MKQENALKIFKSLADTSRLRMVSIRRWMTVISSSFKSPSTVRLPETVTVAFGSSAVNT